MSDPAKGVPRSDARPAISCASPAPSENPPARRRGAHHHRAADLKPGGEVEGCAALQDCVPGLLTRESRAIRDADAREPSALAANSPGM
jgi:hypothetical protein